MRNFIAMLALLCCAAGAQAQTANPIATDLKQMYGGIKSNLTKMAEKVPDDAYSFKATPDIRTFGQLIAHVADAQARFCSLATGENKSVDAGKKTSKAELVDALKKSFEICDAAYDSFTDAKAGETVKMGNNDRTKFWLLSFNIVHDNEEYGYMSVYLRLKGIVPPSSEGR